MNVVYLIGVGLAVLFTLFGIVVSITLIPFGVSFNIMALVNFFDISSILIVIGGTLAVVIACYPKEVKSLPKHFAIMLKANAFDPAEYIEQLT